ncbi:DUF6090 family protein [Rasiella sp. SM2506]|uniref:DUF6090 family protein n=1 Tax=Rasiella sp. SM2506 TaxID=3423914 RepID=UPI003D79507A
MIKFFRRIRKNLLTENKFSKYLLYAIGEIILVVIGILIALNINNWNEERKEKVVVRNVLKDIRYDLVADTVKFSRDLQSIPGFVDNAKSLLNGTFSDTISANSLFYKMPYTAFNYKVKNQSYEKVVNAGITDFFEYNELFDLINTYYTIDSNGYNVITKWDSDGSIDEGKLWIAMGYEIDIFSDNDFYKENEIQFAQKEAERKAVLLEKLREPNVRNSIKMNTYRKMRLNETVQEMKQKAKDIILKIDEHLKE